MSACYYDALAVTLPVFYCSNIQFTAPAVGRPDLGPISSLIWSSQTQFFFSDLPGASNWPLSTERIIKGNEPEQRQWAILTATVVAATAYLPADQLTEPSLRSLILSSKFFDHPVFLFVSRETKTPTWSVCTLLLFPFHCVFIVFVHYIVHAVLCTYMPSTVVTLSPS